MALFHRQCFHRFVTCSSSFIKFRVRFSSHWLSLVGRGACWLLLHVCECVFVLIHDFLHYYTTNIKRTTLFAFLLLMIIRESLFVCVCVGLREVETNRFTTYKITPLFDFVCVTLSLSVSAIFIFLHSLLIFVPFG